MDMVTVKTSSAPQCMGREQVASRLGVSQRMADTLILNGKIKSLLIGRKRLVTEASLAEFIRQREAASNRSE